MKIYKLIDQHDEDAKRILVRCANGVVSTLDGKQIAAYSPPTADPTTVDPHSGSIATPGRYKIEVATQEDIDLLRP